MFSVFFLFGRFFIILFWFTHWFSGNSLLEDVLEKTKTTPNPLCPEFSTCLIQLCGARADSTVQNYVRETRHYLDWCKQTGSEPMGKSPVSCFLYLSNKSVSSRSASSVETAHSALVWFFNLNGIQPNPAQASICKLLIDSAKRCKPKGFNKKDAISFHDFERLITSLLQSPTVFQLRLAVLCCVLFFGTMRIGEALSLCKSDVDWSHEKSGFVVLNLRESKCDVYREGNFVPVSSGDNFVVNFSNLLKSYFTRIGLNSAPEATPIFCGLVKTKDGHSFSPAHWSVQSANKDLKTQFTNFGLADKTYSFHSFRAGSATHAINMGTEFRKVMRHGRWKSLKAFSGYLSEEIGQRVLKMS
jgi:site-specific recombinase XerD